MAPLNEPPDHHVARDSLLWLVLAVLVAMAWDFSGLDLRAAQVFGSGTGFPLRDNWFMNHVMHDGARRVSWLLVILLTLGIVWPFSVLRRIDRTARVQLVTSVLIALVAVSLVKTTSKTSCPWDLVDFGGTAQHISHWAFGVRDGGGGRCFPAGHASAGFAFLCGWFAFRRQAPGVARVWLTIAIVAGFVLGLAQQARGAHFMSHTLWTGCISWAAACAMDALFQAIRRRTTRSSKC